MWPFTRAKAGASTDSPGESATADVLEEADYLEMDAEETRLKHEALLAAEYREQMRSAVAASMTASSVAVAPASPAPSVGDCISSCPTDEYALSPVAEEEEDLSTRTVEKTVPHFNMDDSDFDATDELCEFVPEYGRDPISALSAAKERLREVETELVERQEQLENQEKKLSSASRVLNRTRSQVQQQTAQLALKEIQQSRLEDQVAQLRTLLIEKETRLQAALDEVAAANEIIADGESEEEDAAVTLKGTVPVSDTIIASSTASDAICSEEMAQPAVSAQQPQEPPVTAQSRRALATQARLAHDEEHIMVLTRLTEDLAAARNEARENEQIALEELAQATARLHEEEAARAQLAQALASMKNERECEAESADRPRSWWSMLLPSRVFHGQRQPQSVLFEV